MNESQGRHNGRHYVVSGAGTGIGKAIAMRLARDGASLSLFARNVSRLENTAREATAAGAGSIWVGPCDVRNEEQVQSTFAALAENNGAIDGFVANSGIGGSNEAGNNDRFHELVATNLTGTYTCLRAAEQHLSANTNHRSLVVVSSILARIGVGGYTGYCASKAALLGLVRALAVELAPTGVHVNAICPGWVDTEMAQEGIQLMANGMGVSKEQAHAIAMQDVPLGRMGKPAEVAGMVSWLLSEDARGVTGQGLDQNGGAFMI